MFIIYSISLSSHTKFLFYVYFMLTVAPGGNNLATICYKDFLGLATINMYYYYYYYYYFIDSAGLFQVDLKFRSEASFLHHFYCFLKNYGSISISLDTKNIQKIFYCLFKKKLFTAVPVRRMAIP